jgi:sugar lactone lactonase YvrE
MKQYAGSGSASYSGDNGVSSSAALNSPYSAFVDSLGDMYIADTNNHRIRKVNGATNIITTLAGLGTIGVTGDGGPASSASLFNPKGVWVASNGIVYLADTNNHRIRTVTTNGIINTFVGTGTKGYNNSISGDNGLATSATMGLSYGLVGDTNGNLYFSEYSFHKIRKISSSGIVTNYAGTGNAGYSSSHEGMAATSAALNNPSGLSIDTDGDLYIADYKNYRIRKVVTGTGLIYGRRIWEQCLRQWSSNISRNKELQLPLGR